MPAKRTGFSGTGCGGAIRGLTLVLSWLAAPVVLAVDWSWQEAAALEALAVGESLRLASMPLGADRRGPVRLERIDLYAPTARVLVEEDGVRRLFQPGARVFLAGQAEDGSAHLVLWQLDDEAGWGGAVTGRTGLETLRAYAEPDGLRFLGLPSDALLPDGQSLISSCSGHPQGPSSQQDFRFGPVTGRTVRAGELRIGRLAIDTDKEWLQRRFSNNLSAAASWIEELMLVSNTIFERDVNLRFQLADVILRVGSDPYTVNQAPASEAALLEFGSWWFANQGSVARTHAALISGRAPAENQASGIAWLDSYCQAQSVGGSYSVNQLFYGSWVPLAQSARVFAHEIGHNLGSPHTHCFNPPLDQCFNAEPGCYAGPVSCPAAGTGTLMSYCQLVGPNAANCGPVLLELAPAVANLINTRIAANFPACITPEDKSVIFQDRFQ